MENSNQEAARMWRELQSYRRSGWPAPYQANPAEEDPAEVLQVSRAEIYGAIELARKVGMAQAWARAKVDWHHHRHTRFLLAGIVFGAVGLLGLVYLIRLFR